MPRIRTIKPEYWSHQVMARQEDAVQKLGVALLNFCDDEGYFSAEPGIVRSNCFPLDEDSTKARRCLATLADIGYIEVREHPTNGTFGRVVNFNKHQKIDKPTPSKLKSYFVSDESPKTHRAIDKPSLLEQVTGKRERVGEQGIKQLPPTPLVNEGGVLRPEESSEKPKATAGCGGTDFWSAAMLELKSELSTASLWGTSFNLPYEYDTLFRDTWQSRIEGGTIYVGSENPAKTATALKKYERRLRGIFQRLFRHEFECEAEISEQ